MFQPQELLHNRPDSRHREPFQEPRDIQSMYNREQTTRSQLSPRNLADMPKSVPDTNQWMQAPMPYSGRKV